MTLDPVIKARITSEEYAPGKRTPQRRHGHFAHVCRMSRESLGPRPNLPIRIEKIGSGAAPEGYAAMMWSGLTVEQPLMWPWTEPVTVEALTEHECFEDAIRALEGTPVHGIPHWEAKKPIHNDLNPFLSGRDKLEIQFQVLDLVKRVDAHLLT